MSAQKKQPKFLSAKKSEDFSEWYNQILFLSNLIDKRYNVKGTFVWMPYGFEVMNSIKKEWDRIFKSRGYKEMYFPLLVPLEYCEQNDAWWNGFKDEAFWVKGLNDKKHNWILRPTGEPAMYPMFATWIRSHNDLPLKIYETVSSFRYETKHTRPMIRDREITFWYEIHTAHETKEESENELKIHDEMIHELWNNCALEPLKVKKPHWEVFPGAIGAIEYYSYMNNRVMENGSFNNLGQAYAKKFNIKFKDKNGEEKYAWMTCTGNGARLLVAIIAEHGDDRGLVLPPKIAPLKCIIIPIYKEKDKNKILNAACKIYSKLSKKWSCDVDMRDNKTPGNKFYDAELKGIPIRIEVGPLDIKKGGVTVVVRDTLKKEFVKTKDLVNYIEKELEEMHNRMLKRSKNKWRKIIKIAKSKEEIKQITVKGLVAKVSWCGSDRCADELNDILEGVELFGTDLKKSKGKCVICGQNTSTIAYVASTY